jgi:hypothetical protein
MAKTNAAIDTAVQNAKTAAEIAKLSEGTSLNGQTLGQVVDPKNLDKGDLAKAYDAMNAAYDIQWGKDGIEETSQKLQGLQGKVGEHVYAVAKIAMAHCEGKLLIARAYFLALCSQAEDMKTKWYTGKYHEEKPIGQLIPLWSQYKSSIAKGLEKGLSPFDLIEGTTDAPRFATAAQFRAEVQKIEKEAKGANERPEGTQSDGQVATGLSVITSGWSSMMRASMEVLCKALNGLSHEDQDAFSAQIRDLAEKVMAFQAMRKAGTDPKGVGQAISELPKETKEELDPGTRAAMQAELDKAAGTVAAAHPDKSTQEPGQAEAGKGGKSHKKGVRAA